LDVVGDFLGPTVERDLVVSCGVAEDSRLGYLNSELCTSLVALSQNADLLIVVFLIDAALLLKPLGLCF